MIYQIDPKTNMVKAEWPTVEAAANALLIDKQCILRCIRGERGTSYGYRWTSKLPKEKMCTRRRIEDLNAAKALTEAYGGNVEDYL